jgi:hypothetical protein
MSSTNACGAREVQWNVGFVGLSGTAAIEVIYPRSGHHMSVEILLRRKT